MVFLLSPIIRSMTVVNTEDLFYFILSYLFVRHCPSIQRMIQPEFVCEKSFAYWAMQLIHCPNHTSDITPVLLQATGKFCEYFSLHPASSHANVQTHERIYSVCTICWLDTEVQSCATRDRFIMLQAMQISQYPVNTGCIWPSLITLQSTYVLTSISIWCGISINKVSIKWKMSWVGAAMS